MTARATAVRFSYGTKRTTGDATVSLHELDTGRTGETLEEFLAAVSRRHPDLAPVLEDAIHQADLEIRINDAPVEATAAERVRLRPGDSVELVLK